MERIVEDDKSYTKDLETGAILCNDLKKLNDHKKKKRDKQRLDDLEKNMDEMKDMLFKILNNTEQDKVK